jgi:tyrosyl-tRNA synthetase
LQVLIFEKLKEQNKLFIIERPEKYGGKVIYLSYPDLEKAFVNKEIYPTDLKSASAKYINELLKPIREHFQGIKEQKNF